MTEEESEKVRHFHLFMVEYSSVSQPVVREPQGVHGVAPGGTREERNYLIKKTFSSSPSIGTYIYICAMSLLKDFRVTAERWWYVKLRQPFNGGTRR